ncbi:MAG: IclR family transcriptional regulator [Noviherbaspirillum sp.]
MSKEQAQPRTLERRQRVQSAEMGMSILKALGRLDGAATLTRVAAEVGESTAKVHRYMASLAQEGLVEQDPGTQRYHLGREAIRIGLAALRQCDPIRLGEAALVRLREELGVTCFIAIMGNMGPTILRFEEPGLPVTINVRAGSVLPILWSATGQVFLSFMDDPNLTRQAQEEYVRAAPEQRAWLGQDQPVESLRKAVREQGCASIRDILLNGIGAVAAPIFDHTGKVCAVLTALGAAAGFDTRPHGKIAPMVMRQADEISEALGFDTGKRQLAADFATQGGA